MSKHDDNEHSKAYERAKDDHISTYINFANIVQHYDETARPEHDDIDFEPEDFDGAEYDDTGELVTLYGVLLNFFAAFDDATDVDYFNDDDDFDLEEDELDQHEIRIYRYEIDPPKGYCDRPYTFFKYGKYFKFPPF